MEAAFTGGEDWLGEGGEGREEIVSCRSKSKFVMPSASSESGAQVRSQGRKCEPGSQPHRDMRCEEVPWEECGWGRGGWSDFALGLSKFYKLGR